MHFFKVLVEERERERDRLGQGCKLICEFIKTRIWSKAMKQVLSPRVEADPFWYPWYNMGGIFLMLL